MTGSIKKRGKKWYYTVDLPRGEDGQRRQRRRGGFSTRKAAEEALREWLGHMDRGGDPFGDKTIFGEYARAWLDHHRTQVEPKTWTRYESLPLVHQLPHLGGMRLQRMKVAHVQATLDAIDRSPRTVQHVRGVLSKMMRQAVASGLMPGSPVAATRAPKAERPDLDVTDVAGAQALMKAGEGTVWEMPLFLAAYTEARRGEVAGLDWDCVDLDRGRIRVARSLERHGGEFRFKEPKTARSRREVAIFVFRGGAAQALAGGASRAEARCRSRLA